jgi:hypothetical protein
MQKARGNHCIKKISQVSVVHENCCKPILTIENNKRERVPSYIMPPVVTFEKSTQLFSIFVFSHK